MNNNTLSKSYSVMLPILFVLNGYGIGSIPIGIGSMGLIIYVVLSLFNSQKMTRTKQEVKPLLLFFFYVFLSLIAFFAEDSVNIGSVLNNTLKTAIWATAISVLAPNYLLIDKFKSFFGKFCLFCTIYLFSQNFLWMGAKVFLPNLYTLGPIHPLYDQYSQETLREYITSTSLVRFGSILSEPAFYGHLMLIYLCLLLFNNEGRNELMARELMKALFISAGIIISTSTGAIVFLGVVWVIYLAIGKNIRSLLALVLGILVVSYILFLSPLKDNTTISWFVYKLMNMDSLGRVGKSFENLGKLSGIQKVIGVGIGNTGIIVEGYLNSFTSILISYGIIGFIAYLFFVISTYFSGGTITRVLIILYTLGSFQGAIAFSFYGMLYITIAIMMISIKDHAHDRTTDGGGKL